MEEKMDVPNNTYIMNQVNIYNNNNTPRSTQNDNNIYDKYGQYNKKELIDVIEHLEQQNGILKQENADLNFENSNTWKDMYYYRNELWQEQQHHSETYWELIEKREKIKELEKELFLSEKIPHLFWKYILSKSDILKLIFEIVCG